jgi:hypothetical protein
MTCYLYIYTSNLFYCDDSRVWPVLTRTWRENDETLLSGMCLLSTCRPIFQSKVMIVTRLQMRWRIKPVFQAFMARKDCVWLCHPFNSPFMVSCPKCFKPIRPESLNILGKVALEYIIWISCVHSQLARLASVLVNTSNTLHCDIEWLWLSLIIPSTTNTMYQLWFMISLNNWFV